MTTKSYKTIKLFLTIIIAIVFSISISHQRDQMSGGKSALLAIQIYSWIAVVSMLLLYSLQDYNPNYEAVALTLAFSTCILMLVYSAIFYYYNKMKLTNRKTLYLIVVVIIFLFLSIFTFRVFSGEDSWMCENGEWIEHGHPSFPAPNKECK